LGTNAIRVGPSNIGAADHRRSVAAGVEPLVLERTRISTISRVASLTSSSFAETLERRPSINAVSVNDLVRSCGGAARLFLVDTLSQLTGTGEAAFIQMASPCWISKSRYG